MYRAILFLALGLWAIPSTATAHIHGTSATLAHSYVAQATPHAPPPLPASNGPTIVRPNSTPTEAELDARKRTAKFTFEFSKAEVVDIVKAISDMTGQNFIIPERVKGQRLTILSPTQITAAEAYQVFHTALAANGISIVRTGRFYKLLDSKDAIKDTIPTCIDDDEGNPECALHSEQMVTALLRLHHVDAAQINPVAKSLLGKDGDISIFQPSNALIISEYAPNLKRIRRILDALDVPGFDDELRLVQIQYSSATEISEKITQVFEISTQPRNSSNPIVNRHTSSGGGPGMGRGQSKEDDNDVQISKIVPDDRTNQIIIKANRRSFDAIRMLISKLDVPIAEGEQGRVHVYYLENAKAEDLASTLSSLAQGSPSTQKKPTSPALPVPGNNSAVPAARAAGVPESATLFEGDVKITADKATNSLLIMASAHDYRSLRGLIDKLDMPRRQVYVEAAILEVNLKDNEDFGLNFHEPFKFNKGDLGPWPTDNTIGFLQSAQSGNEPSPTFTALTDQVHLLQAAGGAVGGIIGGGVNVNVGTSGSVLALPSFGVLLKWLTTTSNANILSTPHILTTDNEQAKIEVGEKIPFNSGVLGSLGALSGLAGMAGSSSSATSGLGALGGLGMGLGATQIQRIDVSLKLTLTPQINESNKIRLEIEQIVEDVTGKDQLSQTPTTSHRSIKTVVVVDDQQTIVLGGLVKDNTTESESKIPLLGDLPIVGWLFKQHSTKKTKTNLMLVLTPYIITSSDDFQRIFERKMQEYEEFASEYYGHRKEFRAHVDYKKKRGPLGHLVTTLRRERSKFENGGDGDGTEMMVHPHKEDKKAKAPQQPPAANTEQAASPSATEATNPNAPETTSAPLETPSVVPQAPTEAESTHEGSP